MTLIELFTSIANAIREKTGKTESIVAENFPAAIEAIKTGAENVVEFTAPKGRIKGDFDGDGFITQSDVDGVSAHTSTGGANITDPVQFWCADTLCDNTIDAKDKLNIQKHLIGTANSFCVAYSRYGVNPDYYNNWSFYLIDSLHGYFYYDVPVSGMTASSSALLLASAYSDCFIGVECMDGIARIKAERLPLTETECLRVWEADGTEWDSINNGLLTKFAELPMGRMKGDVDGDGFITQTDVQIAKDHAQNINYITDEIALWCADVNNDSKINVVDYGQLNSHSSGATNLFNIQPVAGANPDYYGNWAWFKVDDLSGYFYRDIPINGMTANAKAKLLVSDYKDCFIGVECGEGFARVKAERLPIKAVKSFILWESAGFDLEEADGGFKTVNADIPLGRMRGDVDGDGFITFNADFATDTSTDAGKLYAHMTGTGTITDEVALWCANVNNDSLINGNDLQAIMGYFNGTANALTATPTMADYYGNWTWFKVDDLSGYFYRDIPIAGMTANSTAVLLVSNYADCFIGVECLEGVARIKASRCPVAACKGYILWKGYERLKSKYAGMSGTA